jgi:Tfp pilus assembly ATPase PilU
MNDYTQSLVEFYVQRISAMEAALKAAESERDALLQQLLEKQNS